MIAWYWVIVAFIGGSAVGLLLFNSGNNDKVAELEARIEMLETKS